jgi:amino acid permease
MATYDEKKIYDDTYTTTQVLAPSDEHSGAYAESIHPTSQGLKRGLKSRHIAMISIGGVIGESQRDRRTNSS